MEINPLILNGLNGPQQEVMTKPPKRIFPSPGFTPPIRSGGSEVGQDPAVRPGRVRQMRGHGGHANGPLRREGAVGCWGQWQGGKASVFFWGSWKVVE